MNTNDPRFELTRRCRDGEASAEELAQLDSLLREDADFRQAYVRYINLDVALGAVAKTVPMPVTSITPSRARRNVWLSWRPLTAAAAGLVFGLFSATAVWAFAWSKAAHPRELPLVDGGFETTMPEMTTGVPSQMGRWGGDPTEVLGEVGSVKPRSGQRMVRFLATATVEGQRSQFLTADLWQVIALPGEGSRTVRVRAWFNANAPQPARFCIVAVAGGGEASTSRKLWATRFAEGSEAVALCKKTVSVDSDPATWELGELVIQVPAGARVLVIDVAAERIAGAEVSDWFPGQFVDDVSVTTQEEVLP